MAERRMFAKTIIDSDDFLDMPLSTQALYFHLSMRADDDGFLNNARKIMRTIGANQNDYDLLVAKAFIIQFEDGICVIKHWRINNYLRADRYKETIYQDQYKMLTVRENGRYSLVENPDEMALSEVGIPVGIPVVYPGKDSIGKDSIGKDSIGKDSINYQLVADMYNNTCVSFPRCTKLSDNRKKAIKARLNTYSIDDLQTAFEKMESSSFLKGGNNRNWTANFDWCLNDANLAKILDGNYDNRETSNYTKVNSVGQFNTMTKQQQQMQGWKELTAKYAAMEELNEVEQPVDIWAVK